MERTLYEPKTKEEELYWIQLLSKSGMRFKRKFLIEEFGTEDIMKLKPEDFNGVPVSSDSIQ